MYKIYYTVISLLLPSLVLALLFSRRRSQPPLPPGPSGWPIIGNALQMPTGHEWLTFARWSRQYGDVIYVSAFDQATVVLNTLEAITDLLDRKNAIYSDRPRLLMAGEMMGYANFLPLSPHGTRHREGRKLLSNALSARKIQEGSHEHEIQSQKLLFNLLTSPAEFHSHLRCFVAAIVFRLSHGYEVTDINDPLVQLADQCNRDFCVGTAPGAFLVDLSPVLQHVPTWFPGAGFKRKAQEFRKTFERVRDEPYEHVRNQVIQGTATPSFAETLLRDNPHPSAELDDLFKCAAAIFYAAGADTTVSALESFYLAMSLYPNVQRKAQAELDSVLGANCLPTLSDRPKLPYVESLIKEVYRWNPVTPLSLPHKVMQDDVYKGHFIPAGSTVLANVWAVMHDPSVYPEPYEFRPERYLSTEKGDVGLNPNPQSLAFGFERRVCPGQLLADASIFIAVARTLAAFDISKALDEHGVPIEPEVNYTEVISHPGPFSCRISPRTSEMGRLLAAFGGED
ncbi:cytochrome P450 [Amylocystis lapponica]|nr:cytochrome P450 [Amylocystis lapponica]